MVLLLYKYCASLDLVICDNIQCLSLKTLHFDTLLVLEVNPVYVGRIGLSTDSFIYFTKIRYESNFLSFLGIIKVGAFYSEWLIFCNTPTLLLLLKNKSEITIY